MDRFVLVALICLMSWQAPAKEMSFTLQEKDLRPNLDLFQWIFADGDIVPATTDRFTAFVNANPQLRRGATVILNSPGGSVSEGMRLGDLIRALHFRTDVGLAGTEPMTRVPGQCLSACIYPYLGGEYRYLADGSTIGIHQFRFDQEFGGAVTSEVSQWLSGQIVEFIKRSRADPDLFAMMTRTAPSDIQVIPQQDLEKLNVVTGDIYSEEWSFEVQGPYSYLKADQMTWRGENKLLFRCLNERDRKSPIMMTVSELPDRDTVIRETKDIFIDIDDQVSSIAPSEVRSAPSLGGGDYVFWTIILNPNLAARLKVARTIGSGLSPGPGIFAGVKSINVGKGHEKLARILTDCDDSPPAPAMNAPATASSSASNPLPVTLPPPESTKDESALARRVAKNFDQKVKKDGITGVKSSVESCYSLARKTRKLTTLEYCYLLDQIASSLDAAMERRFNRPQDDFWLAKNALSRTIEVMNIIERDAEANRRTIQVWDSLLPISWQELNSLK